MLSERGKGFKIALNSLNVGRIKLAAACLDASRRTLTESVRYANERIQFKQPISNFGAIKYKLAEQTIKTYALESAVFRVSNLMQEMRDTLKEQGKSYSDGLLESAEEYAIECALLKVAGSEVLDYVVDEGVQIHGGYGFVKEFHVERLMRDAKITQIYEGTSEIQKIVISRSLLK